MVVCKIGNNPLRGGSPRLMMNFPFRVKFAFCSRGAGFLVRFGFPKIFILTLEEVI